MSKLSFAKYEGAGNDFILIDDRTPSFPLNDKTLIQRLCHRKRGIGADGLILLQLDSSADYRMRIFNADGSEAESCGNGLRCLVLFLSDLGLPPKKTISIRTADRIVQAEWRNGRVAIQLGAPYHLKLHQTIDGYDLHTVDTGVPHAVLFVPDVLKADLSRLGPTIRHHPHFQPHGTNFSVAALNPDHTLSVRTYERGVESEVLACGTGAAAVAVIAAHLHPLPNPIQILFPGGLLEIEVHPSSLTLIGPAVKLFNGLI